MVLALFALFSATEFKRKILIFTSRNHTAWDITETIWNYAQRIRNYINPYLFNSLVIHHYSKTRLGRNIPLPSSIKTKGPKNHLVS